jgi:diguanylate cyclase (GGDEF)-like protein
MSSAATTAASAADQQASARRRRNAKPPVTRRSAFQLLIGVLIVGAIPIVSTARILQTNALRNERAHADATLRAELQNALRELNRLGSDASARADDLARSPVVQRALMRGRRTELRQLAATSPGTMFFLRGVRVAGPAPAAAIERSIWLTVDGTRIGKVVASVALDRQLARRLTRHAPHERGDQLLLTRRGRVLGSGEELQTEGRTVRLGGVDYRALPALVPDAARVRLLALRPEHTIKASVAPYQARIRYAAMGSFALLVLVAFLFAGPILRVLGDFRRVASQASTDSLTGLANRRMLDEELALEWRRADRVGDSLAFVLLDLDDFKRVNDNHGHQAGDAVLRAVGEILGSGVRQVDLAGRYGGEEFALILPETDLAGARKLAERLRVALAQAHIELPGGGSLQATASFGVAVKGKLSSAEELVSAADEALYEAKRAGKNRVAPEPAPDPEDEPPKAERRRPRKTTKKAAPKTAAVKKPAKQPAAKRKPRVRRPAEGEA